MVLAFDLGGSHISSALIDGDRRPQRIVSRYFGKEASADDLLQDITAAGLEAVGQEQIAGISMAAPRPFDYENGISLLEHKHRSLFGQNLRILLAAAFGLEMSQVVFLHDAQAFLLGEIQFGQFDKGRRAVGVTLGTGVGSAFANCGAILDGGKGVPLHGEIYNLPWGAGIVEDKISTRALCASYKLASGRESNVKELASVAEADPEAMQVFREFGSNLGTILDAVLRDFQPEYLILGGAISRSAHLFLPAFKASMRHIHPNILQSKLFETASLLGAADYWFSGPPRTVEASF